MKERLQYIYLPFILLWMMDFFSKSYFAAGAPSMHWNYLNLAYYENHGIIMGTFSKLPLLIRTVFLSTIGISLVASFPIIMELVHFRSKKIIFGLALLFSGIIGNVTDRIIYGYVVDFIYFKGTSFVTPVFNIADAGQWIAYVFLISGWYTEMNHHFPDDDKRSSNWINKKFQLKFCFVIAGLVFSTSTIFFGFSYLFFKHTLLELNVYSQKEISDYLIPYSITSASMMSFISLIILFVGRTISHRIAGPIFAMTRYLKDTLDGKTYGFKLREKDEFRDLEKQFTEINQEILVLRQKIEKYESSDEPPELPPEILELKNYKKSA